VHAGLHWRAKMPETPASLRDLVELVARLRSEGGCAWDREQRLADLRAYLVEEAHELAVAIDHQSWPEIAAELGDLLFQAAFIGCLGEEVGALSIEGVVAGVHRKMVDRHPHVFGGAEVADADAVRELWERRKLEAGGVTASGAEGLLAGVPESAPALVAAFRLGQKAAGVGFDWPDVPAVLAKVDEEVGELRAALAEQPADAGAVAEELGDLLFALASLGRHLGVDPEAALAAANRKFRRRFAELEQLLAGAGGSLAAATGDELEALWQRVKARERA
jgi:nucleoside triphosphate diphosphatase